MIGHTFAQNLGNIDDTASLADVIHLSCGDVEDAFEIGVNDVVDVILRVIKRRGRCGPTGIVDHDVRALHLKSRLHRSRVLVLRIVWFLPAAGRVVPSTSPSLCPPLWLAWQGR